MFVKLKDLLHKSDYNVTDEEVEKAFQNLGYTPITNSQKVPSKQTTGENNAEAII